MASTLKINTLTGVTTAGSIAVTGEGNSTTTNLQQGLCKCWISTPADGASINDSFNVSSATDTDTGKVAVNINNDMSNANYAVTLSTMQNVDQPFVGSSTATGSYDTRAYNGSGYSDIGMRTAVHGDLA